MKHSGALKLPWMRVREVAARAFRMYFAPCHSSALRYALLGVMTLGAAFQVSKLVLPPPYGEGVVTRMGEWQSLRLSDGSVIDVGPNTRLNVRYSAGYRRINIRQGEVTFDVASDAARPFIVVAGVGEARAMGTQFRVAYAPPNDMRVTVMEGVVSVTNRQRGPPPSDPPDAVPLKAGEMASLSSGDLVISQSDDTRRVRWEGDALRVRGAAVGEVVAQINLRTGSTIVIDDPSIASFVIRSMLLTQYSLESFSMAMASSPNIAEYRRGGAVHLTSEPGACALWLRCDGQQ